MLLTIAVSVVASLAVVFGASHVSRRIENRRIAAQEAEEEAAQAQYDERKAATVSVGLAYMQGVVAAVRTMHGPVHPASADEFRDVLHKCGVDQGRLLAFHNEGDIGLRLASLDVAWDDRLEDVAVRYQVTTEALVGQNE